MPKSNGPKFAVNEVAEFVDQDAAREFLEQKRWPDGVVCPQCGVIGASFRLQARGRSTRPVRKGVWKCGSCREQFTVTVGAVMEDSHIPLNKWLLAFHLLCASKKGMSAHQLHRMLGVTYKSAWFMAHRIRHAMTQEPLSSKLDGVVEIDEAYIGGKRRRKNNPGGRPQEGEKDVQVGKRVWGEKKPVRAPKGIHPHADKEIVVSILQRDGEVRSQHVKRVTAENLRPMIEEAVEESAHIMTDTSTVLASVPKQHKHSQVNQTEREYVRHEDGIAITTNTVEGYFGILKRGIDGIYHHVGKQYLDQYMREFDFRYNVRKLNDQDRSVLAIKKTAGKR